MNLNAPWTPGRHGLVTTPQQKTPSQGPNQRQGDETEPQGVQTGVANGVTAAAQNQMEDEDGNAAPWSPDTPPEGLLSADLVNGDRSVTAPGPAWPAASDGAGSARDGSWRTAGPGAAPPLEEGGADTEAKAQEGENGESPLDPDQLDQHQELKVKGEPGRRVAGPTAWSAAA